MNSERLTPKAAVVQDPERILAAEWMGLFYRQRGINELSPAARSLEEREIDRLADELVARARKSPAKEGA